MYTSIPILYLANTSVSILSPIVSDFLFLWFLFFIFIYLRVDCGRDEVANGVFDLKIDFRQSVLKCRCFGMLRRLGW